MSHTNTTKAYLYRFLDGKIHTYEGEVSLYHIGALIKGRFYGNCKSFQCNGKPGVVQSSIVWFPEKNEQAARDALIEYYEDHIEDLQDKIDGYKMKIRILRREFD